MTGVFAFSMFAGVITSCFNFLNDNLTTQRNTDYFNTEEGVESLSTGIYFNQRFHFASEWSYAITNYGTDDFNCGADGTNYQWDAYLSSLSSEVQTSGVITTRTRFGMKSIKASILQTFYCKKQMLF